MSLLQKPTASVVCDEPGCFEEVGSSLRLARSYAISHGWQFVTLDGVGKDYCPKHVKKAPK